jgi:hypothetical protein
MMETEVSGAMNPTGSCMQNRVQEEEVRNLLGRRGGGRGGEETMVVGGRAEFQMRSFKGFHFTDETEQRKRRWIKLTWS